MMPFETYEYASVTVELYYDDESETYLIGIIEENTNAI
jgi:uncharacterized FlaG/YvyC family protein